MSCTCTGLDHIVGWHNETTMSRRPEHVDSTANTIQVEAERHNSIVCTSYFPVLGMLTGGCLLTGLNAPKEMYSCPAKAFLFTRAMLACTGAGVACLPVDAAATCYFCYYQQNPTAAGNAGCLSARIFCCLQPTATTLGGDTASQTSEASA